MLTTETNTNQIDILLVDDDEGDVLLTRKALQKQHLYSSISSVSDGVEALKFLRHEAPYENAARPDLILLDLNMPRKDGRETLAEIKADESLKSIPVIVLTTSDAYKDVAKSYDLKASCFITKPVDLKQFVKVVQSLEEFWLTIVKFAPR
jgi:two-component system response regulator